MIYIKRSGNRLAEFYEEDLFRQTTSLSFYKNLIIYCLFGTVFNDLLIQSFLNFVFSMEKALLQEALKTTNVHIYQDEDFLELLDHFNCDKECIR